MINVVEQSKDDYDNMLIFFEKHNYLYYKDDKNMIIALRNPEDYIDGYNEFLYKMIWEYYLSQRWNTLIKYSYIYSLNYENGDHSKNNIIDEHKFHHVLFFLAYGHTKLGNIQEAKIVYDKI